LQGVQREASSTGLRCQARDGPSWGGMSESETKREFFWPVLPNAPAVEFMKKFDHARVIRKLGQGGFGHVHELTITTGDLREHETFACKMIHLPDRGGEEAIERARNEIKALQVLDHPHIITFAGAFISAKEIMISTRPVANCNLKEFLNRQSSPLSSVARHQLWEAVGGLASAIAYVHGYGLGGGFHGDIKPENILVIQDTEVKSWTRLLLADFRSARLPAWSSRIGHNNQAVTPRYCAPEWFTNNNEKGPPSDIWSFGCVLTQIVTYLHGRTMADFEAFRAQHTVLKKDWTYQESLSTVNDWLRVLSKSFKDSAGPVEQNGYIDLISDMLSTSPKERPSAIDVVNKLETYSKLFTANVDQDWNYNMRLTELREMHEYSPTNVVHTANCTYENQGTQLLGKWTHKSTR
jgi:serine/threonine protein kinase